jgi:predicted Ser/Thr protein kinase
MAQVLGGAVDRPTRLPYARKAWIAWGGRQVARQYGLDADMTELEIGQELAGFRLERELGRGGMGVVYLARQLNLRRQVAVKVIAPALSHDPNFTSRFEREARLAAALDHPNVVPVFEAGEAEGLLYLAMRYVRGTDLASVLRRDGRLQPQRVAAIARQLGAALDCAHAAGLIHRDVKPANILLASDGSHDEHVYLTDFGVTKEAGSVGTALTQSGHWVGTLDYIAPEQFEPGQIDARADVYSMGCVMFQMLSGRVPYEGSDVQKIWGHASGSIPSLRELDPRLDRMDAVVARAMAKRPDERFPSAGDLGRAATAAASGETVTVPERSVATGVAAVGASDSVAGAEVQAARGRREPEPPTAKLSEGVRRPGRPRLVVGLAVAVLLVVGGALAVLLSTGDGTPEPKRAGATQAAEPAETTTDATPTPPANELEEPAPTAVSFADYTPSAGGYSTEIPRGSGWSPPSETEPTPDRLLRTTINGPDGLVMLIDFTPLEPAQFGGEYDSRRELGQAAFGTMTEYVFSGGAIPQCQRSRCVDYIINDEERGSGYGVLAGGSDNFELAQKVARRAAESLVYSGS